jgi:signal transduction histidine kinase
VVEHLLAALREAVTNIARHAEATEANVILSIHGNLCRLQVSDNGRGMGAIGTKGGGRGMVNMQRRAEKLDGHLQVTSNAFGGTTVDWQVIAQ